VKTVVIWIQRGGKGRWRRRSVPLHDPGDVGAVLAAIKSAFGSEAAGGDRIHVKDGRKTVHETFTVAS
jgi:hypothetical protein